MNATDTAPTVQHRIGETGFVTVRLADWDADIRAVDGDTVTVRNAEGGALPGDLRIDHADGAITVAQVDRSGITFAIGRRAKDVRLAIDVPAKARVALQTASGDARAHGLHGPLNTRTASGDLMLVDVAGDVQAETVSGDVLIRLDGPSGLTVKTVSGDVAIEGGRVDRFAYVSTSGDLRMKSELGDGPHTIQTVSGDAIVTTRNGIRVSAQTVTGDLSSEMPHLSEGRPGRRSLIVGEGTTAVQFRSVSGDLRVVGPNSSETFAMPKPPTPPTPPTAPMPPTPPAPPYPTGAKALAKAAAKLDAELADLDAELSNLDAEIADVDLDEPKADAADAPDATPAPTDDERLEILRALERGEIDVDEATKRLAGLDGPTDD